MALVLPCLLLSFTFVAFSERLEVPLQRWGTRPTGQREGLQVKYLGPLGIGTPPQKIEVAFHTGQKMNWVPIQGCYGSGKSTEVCKNSIGVFDPSKSSTFRNLTMFFKEEFAGGRTTGYMFKDEVSYLSESGDSLTISRPINLGGAWQFWDGEHAIFGLPSFDFNKMKTQNPNAVLHKNRREISMNATTFTMYMSGCTSAGCGTCGQLTFGDYDDKNCDRAVTYEKIQTRNPLWQFEMGGLNALGKRWSSDGVTTSVDSGSAYIGLPRGIFTRYVKLWGAKEMGDGYTYGLPCNTDLEFAVIMGSEVLEIPNEHLLIPLSLSLKRKYGANFCQLAFKLADGGRVQLGEPFLRSHCVVHDIFNERIGFARKVANADERISRKSGCGRTRR